MDEKQDWDIAQAEAAIGHLERAVLSLTGVADRLLASERHLLEQRLAWLRNSLAIVKQGAAERSRREDRWPPR